MMMQMVRHGVILVVAALAASNASHAADLDAAVDWLAERQNADGVHAPGDIAPRVETNAAAWLALGTVQATEGFTPLEGRVVDENDRSLGSLAVQAHIRLNAGRQAADQLDELLAAQQSDGGFPSHAGFQSDPLTTALVLKLLDRAGQAGATPAARSVGYLMATQHEDGGWRAARGSGSSVFVTAQAGSVLAALRNRFELSTPLSRSTDFLLASSEADGSRGSVFETAFTVMALLDLGAERSEIEPAIDWLELQQLANGSFADDAYQTAAALRALQQWQQPVSSHDRAGLTLRVLSADTRLPIAGAALDLTGADDGRLVSNDDGRIFSTSLVPGGYSAEISFSGMETVAFEFRLLPGELSDLGEIRLTSGSASDPAPGLVRGSVLDRQTEEGIPGAAIAVTPGDHQATTDSAGRYQVLQVPPGDVEVRISAAGYGSEAALATLEPGSILEVSGRLEPVEEPLDDARVEGVVRSGISEDPVEGITIELVDPVTGTPLSSVESASDGQHAQHIVHEGIVEISAHGAEFEPVEVSAFLIPGQVFDFSPLMYPLGEAPPDANKSRITGTVVNQANREPIENALLRVSDSGGEQTVRSAADGRFEIDNLVGPDVRIRISADAFDETSLRVPIKPLEVRDIGEIGLKPTAVQFYFPDLAITGTSLTVTDPDSFELADEVSVEISNGGTSGATQDFDVIAFIDANGDRQFDPDAEPELGSVRVSDDLPIGSAASASIAVSGQMAYRDAPFALIVDPANEVPESDEDNNVASTLLGCRATPSFIGDDGIHEAWRWSGLSRNPDINSISQTPAVAQLTDDNGDGIINVHDVPDIVFVAGRRSNNSPGQTALVVISGDDGREHWARTDIRLSQFSSPAVGDLDNDGIAEIVAVRGYREELVAFEHTGDIKWRVSLDGPRVPQVLFPPPPHVYDMPIIVNLEGDNEAEVIHGRRAFRGQTGEELWQGGHDGGGSDGGVPVEVAFSQAAVAADVDLDGIADVIAGRTRYDYAGNTVWFRDDIKPEGFTDVGGNPQSKSGYVAIGNFDLDDFAEIVLSISDELYLLEHTGETIWGPVNAPDNSEMGVPTVIDLDDDGLPEIIVPSHQRLVVFETDGTIKWTADIQDDSGITGATVFDFENDGLYEIVHNDESDFRIFDARTGAQLFETRHTSPTVFEYPIVADVDGDKQAEILLTGFDRDLVAGVTPGLRVFKAANGAWADAGSVWSSHAFHVDDVAEDGTVPLIETPSWLTHNTYRVQRSPLPDPLGRPDFTLGDLQLLDQGQGRDPVVRVRIGNAGPVDAHEPAWLGLFRGDPQAGGELIAETRLDTLRPAAFQIVNLGEVPITGSGRLYALVDHDGLAEECRESNNQRSVPFAAVNGNGLLQLASDAQRYARDETARFTVSVSNQGGIAADYRVELQIVDQHGGVVTQFEPEAFDAVAAGGTSDRERFWPIGGVLGGEFTLQGRLLDRRGRVVDTASTGFRIGGDVTGLAGSVQLQTDRVEFRPDEAIEITVTARNVSDEAVIESPEVVVAIGGPSGSLSEERLVFDSLLPGAVAETAILATGTERAGDYTASADFEAALAGQHLATAETGFTRLSLPAVSIEGRVDAVLPTLVQGEEQTCLFDVRNPGSADLVDARVRTRVLGTETGTAHQQNEQPLDLPSGASQVTPRSIDTGSLQPGEYLCALELDAGAGWAPLDADGFVIVPPPEVGIRVEPGTALVTGEAGESATFQLVLASAPAAEVTIPLQVTDDSEWALSAPDVTFTPASWNLPRTVVVRGVDDDLVDGTQSGRLSVRPAVSDDPAYAGLDAADIEVTNRDDDAAGIAVAPQSLTTSEDGTVAELTISINTEPAADVRIDLANPDPSEWALGTDSVVFTPDNWQAGQTVPLTGLDDADFDDEQTGVIEVGPARSSDPQYDGLEAAGVNATNIDNEIVSIRVDPLTVVTSEDGEAGTFMVRLAARPTAEVAIPVGFANAAEWQVMASEVRLDETNWADGQSVVVVGVDDEVADGTQTARLELGTAHSVDERYDGLDPADVALVNHDNDGAQVVVSPTSGLVVDESGSTTAFEVRLTQIPDHPVLVPIASLDTSEFAVSTAVLEFGPDDALEPQMVVVTGVDDADADGNITGLVEVGRIESDDILFDRLDPPNVSVTNVDDETVRITVAPDDVIQTSEPGTTETVLVSINHQPTAAVVVEVESSDSTEWQISPERIEFLPDEWSEPRRIDVTGVDDDEIDGPVTGLIRMSAAQSADHRYDGLDPQDLVAVNHDDDTAGSPDPEPPPGPGPSPDPDPPAEPEPVAVPSHSSWLIVAVALLILLSVRRRLGAGSSGRSSNGKLTFNRKLV